MPIVRLHVQKESRRQTLASALAEEHEVLPGGLAASQDRQENLLIFDHTTLQQNGVGILSSYKETDPRPESPILLLVPSARKSDLTAPIWKEVSDVVEIPVRWPEMEGRIDVLICMQELARKEESFRQMSAKYKLMLEELRRQLEEYKDLFKRSALGALVLREGKVVEATFQSEELFGTKDLVGRTFESLSAAKQPSGQNSKIQAEDLLEVAEGEEKEAEWKFKGAAGETFLSSVVFRSVEFRGEKCIHVLFPEGATESSAVFS